MFLWVLWAGLGCLVLVLEKPKALSMLGTFLCFVCFSFFHFVAHADFEPPGYKDYRPQLQYLAQSLVLLLFYFETECPYVV